MEEILKMTGLVKTYHIGGGKLMALNEGECVSILGPSCSGK